MKSKSKFFSYLFSLFPGAGQMYLGFIKQGMSIMFMFFFAIFLADFFRFSLILTILPVIWCYGFFDTLNKIGLTPEELETLEDKNIIEEFFPKGLNKFEGKHIWVGVVLIILGAIMLFDNVVLRELERLNIIPYYAAREYLRTIVAAAVLIGVGIKLIGGKKEKPESEEEKR